MSPESSGYHCRYNLLPPQRQEDAQNGCVASLLLHLRTAQVIKMSAMACEVESVGASDVKIPDLARVSLLSHCSA